MSHAKTASSAQVATKRRNTVDLQRIRGKFVLMDRSSYFEHKVYTMQDANVFYCR
jgi:hypothetical protein